MEVLPLAVSTRLSPSVPSTGRSTAVTPRTSRSTIAVDGVKQKKEALFNAAGEAALVVLQGEIMLDDLTRIALQRQTDLDTLNKDIHGEAQSQSPRTLAAQSGGGRGNNENANPITQVLADTYKYREEWRIENEDAVLENLFQCGLTCSSSKGQVPFTLTNAVSPFFDPQLCADGNNRRRYGETISKPISGSGDGIEKDLNDVLAASLGCLLGSAISMASTSSINMTDDTTQAMVLAQEQAYLRRMVRDTRAEAKAVYGLLLENVQRSRKSFSSRLKILTYLASKKAIGEELQIQQKYQQEQLLGLLNQFHQQLHQKQLMFKHKIEPTSRIGNNISGSSGGGGEGEVGGGGRDGSEGAFEQGKRATEKDGRRKGLRSYVGGTLAEQEEMLKQQQKQLLEQKQKSYIQEKLSLLKKVQRKQEDAVTGDLFVSKIQSLTMHHKAVIIQRNVKQWMRRVRGRRKRSVIRTLMEHVEVLQRRRRLMDQRRVLAEQKENERKRMLYVQQVVGVLYRRTMAHKIAKWIWLRLTVRKSTRLLEERLARRGQTLAAFTASFHTTPGVLSCIIQLQALWRGRQGRKRAAFMRLVWRPMVEKRRKRAAFMQDRASFRDVHDVEEEMVLTNLFVCKELERIKHEMVRERDAMEKRWKEWDKVMTKHYLETAKLGENWISQIDATTKAVYYFNLQTGSSQNEHPNWRTVLLKRKKEAIKASAILSENLSILEQYEMSLVDQESRRRVSLEQERIQKYRINVMSTFL